ncbi:hypothetical protein DIJ64_14895 [Mycobacterium leprae]|uniref:Uncharacterized protein n=1 Tax=Mycobacterium leprae TaxID=1769 RepID=A0AAD0KTX8_MYCLR|nr:hypothetical protein [Mycobacterium leprae]AWV48899.1 hypothetical protein DIJ64_14895 [Mycobacterium leprae]OAR19567.1 hypothetical protein A8144_04720 [Mycobacterium leprae 3125609]OAX71537.1 hypothetical protein A3216_04915 [Mycobacterium leprae 7935681]
MSQTLGSVVHWSKSTIHAFDGDITAGSVDAVLYGGRFAVGVSIMATVLKLVAVAITFVGIDRR